MNQIFAGLKDLVDYLSQQDKSWLMKSFPNPEDYHKMVVFHAQCLHKSRHLQSGCSLSVGTEGNRIRGVIYAAMSFDDRFEFIKRITRKENVTVEQLQKLHEWMLNGEKDTMMEQQKRTEQPELTTPRLRTVTISCARHDFLGYPCFVRFSSSPVGSFVCSRFKQKYGSDSIVNVIFEFPRMGIQSQLYLHTEYDDNKFVSFNELNFSDYQYVRYYSFMNGLFPDENFFPSAVRPDLSEKNTTRDYHHKSKIQEEICSFSEICKYMEKDLQILGCKFSVLCQNLSGIHSYRFVYFCPELAKQWSSTFDQPLSIENVRNWAVPPNENIDLYTEEKKHKLYLRLSLFNTPTIPTLKVTKFKVLDDIGAFTDGCGYISAKLASDMTICIKKYLAQHFSVEKDHSSYTRQYDRDLLDSSLDDNGFKPLPDDYVPSCFQIRFLGSKGMLCVDRDLLSREGCHLALHKSMVKVEHNLENCDDILKQIQVVGYSSPSGNATLTLSIIHLLNGCSDDTGIIQQQITKSMHKKVDSVISSHLNAPISDVIRNYIKENDFVSLEVLSVMKDKKMAFLAGWYRTQLMEMKFPLDKTRRLYGVADPYGVLNDGQVYIHITTNDNQSIILEQEIIITKEPCFHRGDLRKVQAVDIPKLYHLRDVVVFPTRSRPIPNTIAGSDLDGDEYFVCWDKNIVDHSIQYEPAIEDNEKSSFERYISFEPDAFKYWVGIRMVFADYFDKEWTRGENWNSTMSVLCDVLNSAIDAPKQGKIISRKEQLQDIITRFPGFPHYMNKPNSSVRKSTSLIGSMFDEMNNKISNLLGYLDNDNSTSPAIFEMKTPPIHNQYSLTGIDNQRYLWLFHVFFEWRRFKCNEGIHYIHVPKDTK